MNTIIQGIKNNYIKKNCRFTSAGHTGVCRKDSFQFLRRIYQEIG